MKSMMGKLKALKTDLIPPQGSVPAGMTADGKHVLWKRPRPKVVTKDVLDDKGQPVWKKHPTTGESLVKRRTATVEDGEQLFYLFDQGNGNVQIVDYRFPTEKEIAAKKRQERIAAMTPKLAEALVDAGVTPDELVARLTRPAPATPVSVTPAPSTVQQPKDQAVDEDAFPIPAGENLWTLSNGQQFEGTEDEAITAELEVQESRKLAALSPEL